MLFVRWALLLVAILAPVAAQNVVDLTILHFNDFHARLIPNPQGLGGIANIATVFKKERANCPRCLLLNAGDNVQGSPVSTIYRGLPVFEVLRPLGIDAFVVGNHEFDYGADRINDFMAAAGYPLLAANFYTPDGKLFTEASSVVLERDGLRIGVVGVLMEDLVPKLTTPSKLTPNNIQPAIEALRREAAKLKGQTDILIALVHLWKEGCDQIVKELPEYAITVSGHDHGGMEKMFRVEDRVGVRLKAFGTEVGRLDIQYDKAARKIVNANWKIIPIVAKDITPDPEVAKLVEKWERKVQAVVDTPIGVSKAVKSRPEVRAWIERILFDASKADFVHMNQGGVRDTLPEGKLLARQIWTIMPFDNMMVTGKVPGRLIPEFARNGKTVEPDKLYQFSTIDFLIESWRGGNDPKLKELARLMPLEGPLLRDVMIDWVKAKKVVD